MQKSKKRAASSGFMVLNRVQLTLTRKARAARRLIAATVFRKAPG